MVCREISNTLKKTYNKLFSALGPQSWWPGDSPFEVVVGAILTQNTAWINVEKAIENLKKAKVLSPKKMNDIKEKELAVLIRPAGYFNVKAKRIKYFLKHLFDRYGGRIDKIFLKDTDVLRTELLSINGIGPETADSILLYAGNHPVFVVDTYTKRILLRHHIINRDADYHKIQEIFMKSLSHDAKIFNEYHALIVNVGKNYCKSRKPLCRSCPLM